MREILQPGVEEWRPVVSEPDYEVSNIGRVRSLDRVRTYQRVDQHSGRTLTIQRRHRGRILQPGVMQSGHLIVVLGRMRNHLVHRLVLEAFVGPPPDGTECCHRDDDPTNNKLSNLRWDTRSANIADYVRNFGHHQSQRYKVRCNA